MDLSILIPARSEMWLARTIQDILEHIEADTEVIVTLDGEWADPPIPQHPRVNVIYVPESIGQRAATNLACKLSKAKYVAKADAHCAFDQGFDRKMLEAFKEVGDDVTMVPIMYTLHVFDWKCMKCGRRWYQGPTPTSCREDNYKGTGKPCDGKKFTRRMVWQPNRKKKSTAYCFDPSPHFQYFNKYKHHPDYARDLKKSKMTETMSLQGSFFMLTREKYWKLNICDESFGSWGHQGIETACKTWLSGGRVLTNHRTWYAHLFRTQGGDFGFPYPQSGRAVRDTKNKVWESFFDGSWPLQKHPVSWLVERFWPVSYKGKDGKYTEWTDEELKALKEKEVK